MRYRPKKLHRHLPVSLASLALAAGASRALAQSDYFAPPEPQPTMPRLKYISLDTEVEQVNSSSNGGKTDTQDIYLAPAVGIGWDSFIYHPNLLTFSLLAEPGYAWQEYVLNGVTSRQDSLLLNGNFTGTVLQMKPYATVLSYSRSHEDYHYDFFNSATVDAENWGVTSGYREGPVPVNFSFQHSTRDSTGISLDGDSDQTTFNFHAQNSRSNGNLTDLDYQFSQYDSSTMYASQNFKDTSTTHYVSLTDAEHWGKSTLNSSLIYSGQENDGIPSDNLSAALDLGVQHTANLRSFYDYSFATYSSEGANSVNQLARVGLQHQLYESLSSSIDVHGALTDDTAPGTSLDQESAGTSASEEYSKRLGDWGHFSIGDSVSYDLTHQKSSGSELFIANEPHAVPPTGLFFLKQPLDLAVQSITYFNGSATVTLVPGTAPAGDYDIITTTDPWQIRIYNTGPSHIDLSSSPVVQVNYSIQPNPTGDYSVLNNQIQARLDFWRDRAGIYARYDFDDNSADSPGFVLENISEFQTGGDVNWSGFRGDADFTDRHSSLYNYRSVTLTEAYSLRASRHSTAGIDLRQQWSTYPDAGTNSTPDLTYYSFTAHYDWQPVSRLSWNTELGYELQRGAGENQDFVVARSYLNWFVGKLAVRLGYEFQNQEYTTETREQNYAFVQLRRNF
ncbi:MAG TPA: hypothetical protein VMB22_03170 [Verrucomicrobiae bacterium]|nr:hypothetical protein [Verrucomicrobiae bacterium]